MMIQPLKFVTRYKKFDLKQSLDSKECLQVYISSCGFFKITIISTPDAQALQILVDPLLKWYKMKYNGPNQKIPVI